MVTSYPSSVFGHGTSFLSSLAELVWFFTQNPFFLPPLLLTSTTNGEAFGYYGRAWALDEPNLAGPFILQNLLILASAPLLAASVYMSFGRINIALGAQNYTLISPRWITKLYVLIDIGAFVTQVSGAVIPASGDPSSAELGRKVVLGGLITQIAALSFFGLGTLYTGQTIKRVPLEVFVRDPSLNWKNHFRAIGLITVVIIERNAVRMIECIQGSDGTIAKHEVFIYVLDAAPMFFIIAILLVIHPGRLLRNARRIRSKTTCFLRYQ